MIPTAFESALGWVYANFTNNESSFTISEGGIKKLMPQMPEISKAALLVDISVASDGDWLMHGKNTEDVEIAVVISPPPGVKNVSLIPFVFAGSNQFANVNSFFKLDSNGFGVIAEFK